MLARIKEFIEWKGLTIAAFEKQVGLSNATFRNALKTGGSVGIDKLEKILKTFPELNPTWVTLGEGEMLNSGPSYNVSPVLVTVDEAGNDNIVLVDTKAAAGYPTRIIEPTFLQQLPAFKLPGPLFHNGTFRAFEVEGDSMMNTLFPGELVVTRLLSNPDEIKEGYVHVIVTEDEVTIKRVLKPKGSKLTLLSDNGNYPPRMIHLNSVKEIWRGIAHLDYSFTNPREGINSAIQQLQYEMIELKDRVRMLEKTQ